MLKRYCENKKVIKEIGVKEWFEGLRREDLDVRCAFLMATTSSGDIKASIIEAIEPITDLLGGLSYPICYIMLATGLLLVMSGNKSKGLEIAKWAIIGFIGMQFLPVVMALLVKIAEAMVV